MFKNLVGRGHHEFSTNRQQDAAEYLLHLFSIIEVVDVLRSFLMFERYYVLKIIPFSMNWILYPLKTIFCFSVEKQRRFLEPDGLSEVSSGRQDRMPLLWQDQVHGEVGLPVVSAHPSGRHDQQRWQFVYSN